MEDLLEEIRNRIAGTSCPVHKKKAGVSIKAREFDFKVQACCDMWRIHTYNICLEYKLAYLKHEAGKLPSIKNHNK